jgi:hypothetical protein
LKIFRIFEEFLGFLGILVKFLNVFFLVLWQKVAEFGHHDTGKIGILEDF